MSEINQILDEATATFVLSGVAGSYDTVNRITLIASDVEDIAISTVRSVIEAAVPTGTILEVWVLKTGGDPDVDADYTFNSNHISGAQLTGSSFPYARAVQIRAKSGATPGSVTVHSLAI